MGQHVTFSSHELLAATIVLALLSGCERSEIPVMPVGERVQNLERSRRGVAVTKERNKPTHDASEARGTDLEAYPVGGDVKAPVLISRFEPALDGCGQEGFIIPGAPVVRAVVDYDGTVVDVRLVKAIEPCLDRAILTSIKRWKFRPGTYQGKAVRTVFNMTVQVHVS